jgi:hypothetical protein
MKYFASRASPFLLCSVNAIKFRLLECRLRLLTQAKLAVKRGYISPNDAAKSDNR